MEFAGNFWLSGAVRLTISYRLGAIFMAVEWRSLRYSDLSAARTLNEIAGWNQTEADWAGYLDFAPEGCLAAVIDGELAGTATSLKYGTLLGWIGMVLVHPKYRRLGLGTELLRRAIGFLREQGVQCVKLDATPLGRKVYLPLGFQDEYEISRLLGAVPAVASDQDVPVPPPGLARMQAEDLPAVAAFDHRAFGVQRGEILAALSRRNPSLCFVARKGNEVSGYLIAREGREAVQVGPSIAVDGGTAERLFRALFDTAEGRSFLVDLPSSNPTGREILSRYGFKVQRAFTRMNLGGAGPPGRDDLVYGTSGAEKG